MPMPLARAPVATIHLGAVDTPAKVHVTDPIRRPITPIAVVHATIAECCPTITWPLQSTGGGNVMISTQFMIGSSVCK